LPVVALDLAHDQREHSVGQKRGPNDPLRLALRGAAHCRGGSAIWTGCTRVEEALLAGIAFA
jgi:hypothetical protein